MEEDLDHDERLLRSGVSHAENRPNRVSTTPRNEADAEQPQKQGVQDEDAVHDTAAQREEEKHKNSGKQHGCSFCFGRLGAKVDDVGRAPKDVRAKQETPAAGGGSRRPGTVRRGPAQGWR